jgi:methylmalonyl-CoA/ethylmalonyl-CoA epimerase
VPPADRPDQAAPADPSDEAHQADRTPLAGMPGLLGVDHVGIAVRDLEPAVDFHTRVLGLRVTHRETNVEQQVQEVMLAGPGQPSGSVQVQLLAPTDPASTLARFLDRSGPGLQQLAYRVRDVEEAAAHLRAAGVRVLYDHPRRGTAGSLVNFAHPRDCGGVLVELVQPSPDPSGPPTSH